MPTILDLKADQQEAISRADTIMKAAERENRPLTTAETTLYGEAMFAFHKAGAAINANPAHASVSRFFKGGSSVPVFQSGHSPFSQPAQKPMSTEYTEAFLAFLRSGGKQASSELTAGFDPLFGGYALPALPGMSAALYEGVGGGSDAAGGYAVSIPTDPLIVPLGLPDLGVRSVSKVIP